LSQATATPAAAAPAPAKEAAKKTAPAAKPAEDKKIEEAAAIVKENKGKPLTAE